MIVSSVAPRWEYSGMTICVVNLVDVRPLTADDLDNACMNEGYEGDFAWVLRDPRIVEEPFAIKGRFGLFDAEYDAK